MFGYCAIGKPTRQIAPIITIKIAMTIATMGRLIKNSDIARGSWLEESLWRPLLLPVASTP